MQAYAEWLATPEGVEKEGLDPLEASEEASRQSAHADAIAAGGDGGKVVAVIFKSDVLGPVE